MTLNVTELSSFLYPNTSEKYRFNDFEQKPIEIYVFIDPICPVSWSLEPYLKKLSFEFGRFFTIRPIISSPLQMAKNKELSKLKIPDIKADNTILFPSLVILAIKAAELQGNNAGRSFLRKLQEKLFLSKEKNIDIHILIECAIEAKLDILEFQKDLHSAPARKAFQCDLKLTREMDVQQTPTLVFFNQVIEHEGIKVSGLHAYHVYLHILSEMLQIKPIPTVKPSIEDFLAHYGVSSNDEISIIYDLSTNETNRLMRKLQLQRKAEKIVENKHIFWKYIY